MFEKRAIERDGYCRGCDAKQTKGTEIIYTYSCRNRGQSIIICTDCAEKIGFQALPTQDTQE